MLNKTSTLSGPVEIAGTPVVEVIGSPTVTLNQVVMVTAPTGLKTIPTMTNITFTGSFASISSYNTTLQDVSEFAKISWYLLSSTSITAQVYQSPENNVAFAVPVTEFTLGAGLPGVYTPSNFAYYSGVTVNSATIGAEGVTIHIQGIY